jgi:hypothetical protein
VTVDTLMAALVWDRPTLERSDPEEGSQAFIDAMDLRGGKWWGQSEDYSTEEPLKFAARAVLQEADGKVDEAVSAYEELADSPDPLTRLLGLSLRLWCGREPTPAQFDDAQRAVEQLADSVTKARLMMKLVTAAFDHGFDDRLPDLLDEAIALVKPGTQLHRAIEIEGFNLLHRPFTVYDEWTQWEEDPLTSYDWIGSIASNAARDWLIEGVERRARSPRTDTITLGAAPLNRPFAAERQARWAGANWMVRDLQTQLSAHLLSRPAENPRSRSSAVAMWALHGGKQLTGVIERAEADFDETSGDHLVEVLTRQGQVRRRYDPRLLEVGLAAWDLISDDAALTLLDRFPPEPEGHRLNRDVASLWSILSLRVPSEWETRFLALSDELAVQLISTTTPSVADRLPRRAAERMMRLIESSAGQIESQARLYAALARRLGGDPLRIEQADASDLVLAAHDGSPVAQADLRSAVSEMKARVKHLVSDAHEGRYGMGSSNPVTVLALGLEKLEDPWSRGAGALADVASDSAVARNLRYDALRGLIRLTRAGSMPADDMIRLSEEAPEGGAEPIWEDYPRQLIQAAKTTLAIVARGSHAGLAPLVAFARNPSVRVRLEAMDGCGLAKAGTETGLVEATLLGGLYDPNAEVIQRAVGAVKERNGVSSVAGLALANRLRTLFSSEGRSVRCAVVILVRDISPVSGALASAASEILELAGQDRSFQVRDVAMQLPEARPTGT